MKKKKCLIKYHVIEDGKCGTIKRVLSKEITNIRNRRGIFEKQKTNRKNFHKNLGEDMNNIYKIITKRKEKEMFSR